ncbi:MAG: polysulfide reductase NrfD, partial [Candidatus Rokubacteria bacterium]|nr:polysulfide reductase NrfD [Candidatus Rokubacteria bacterium]
MGEIGPVEAFRRRLEERALAPLTRTGRGYYLLVGGLLLVVAWGLYAYTSQLREGLVVTGMRDRIMWGLYITLFVLFIGISHAGTLISAILRVTNAGWRAPITRMAEFITVVALMVGALMPLVDLGRPDRILNLLLYGRWQSPVVWDLLSITTYLTGSVIYLYLPLIPDLALCRDRLLPGAPRWRQRFFRVASLGWRGTPRQRRLLGSAIGMMMVLIIPVAVSVHTVVSWIFAMTLREPWDNPMFGAYFVAGAIFSGIAGIILLMALLRKIYRFEEYITARHFVNLGYMLGAFVLIM